VPTQKSNPASPPAVKPDAHREPGATVNTETPPADDQKTFATDGHK
jgi:hypothetical protein